MFQRKYVVDGEKWEEVTEQVVVDGLKGYYKSVQLAIKEMRDEPGYVFMTPYVMFRWVRGGKK